MESKENDLTPIQRAILKQKELRDSGMLISRSPVEKFLDNPRAGRAIKMFCYQCNGYSRRLANSCPDSSCPLWLFRKGTRIFKQEELEQWRKHYSAFMKSVGEFGPDCLEKEQEDEAPYDNEE